MAVWVKLSYKAPASEYLVPRRWRSLGRLGSAMTYSTEEAGFEI